MPTDRPRRSPGLAIALVVALVFARLVTCAFTDWDDTDTIARNPYLNPPTWSAVRFYWTTIGERTPGQLFTPVTYTVWTATAALSDLIVGRAPDADGVRLSPAVFHAVNVLLHAGAAAVAYGLLRQLVARRSAAAIGALLFALHPVQVEPVAWASGTKDVLCGLFSLAALAAYLRSAKPASEGTPEGPDSRALSRGRRRLLFLSAMALFVLAMLSKPTAIVVPLMALAIDVLLRGTRWPSVARRLWPWFLLMVPCALWTRAAQPAPWAAAPLWQRPLIAADAVAFYLGKIAWPAHLAVDYGHRPAAVFASGVVYWTWIIPAALLALALWRWARPTTTRATEPTEPSGSAAASSARSSTIAVLPRGGAAGLCAVALFLLPLLPVLGLAPFDFQFYSTTADHYLYLPMFAVALLAARSLPATRRATGVAAVVLVALAVRSVVQMGTWRDTPALFGHALAVNPRSFVACDQLGYSEVKRAARLAGGQGDLPPTDPRYAGWRAAQLRARGWYFKALDLLPDYVPALTNIAIVAHRLGDGDEQRWALRRVVDLQPVVPPGLRADPAGLAHFLLGADDPATAVRVLDDALRADPANVPLMLERNRALELLKQKR